MKNGKLAALLNTPLGVVIAVGLIVLVSEYLIMVLFEVFQVSFPSTDAYSLVGIFNYFDPILLVAIISPVLYLLIFRPMRQQQIELTVVHQKLVREHQDWIYALDVVDDPIFMHDKNFRILSCNKAYQQCAGLPFNQIIGQPYYEIFPKIGAPLPGYPRSKEKTEEEVAVGGTIFRARAFSVCDVPGIHLSMHILEDITERNIAEEKLRDSEEQYRTIIENSNDLIWTLSPDGRFTFINQQAADVTGRSIADWLGKTFEPLVLEEDLPMVLEIHGKIMSGEKVHYEVRGKKADGSILTLSVNASPIFKNGQVSGTISFARDITERKRAEDQLAEQMEELRAWHDVTLGREMRILELKHEVDELLVQAGQPPRYPSVESDDQQEK